MSEASWLDILDQWVSLEMDFQDRGLDLEDLLDKRTWRWFCIRTMTYVVDPDTRIHRALIEKRKANYDGADGN